MMINIRRKSKSLICKDTYGIEKKKKKIEQKLADWNKIEHKRHADELGNGETSCSLRILPHYQSIPVD